MEKWKRLKTLTDKNIPDGGVNALIFDAPFAFEDRENLTGEPVYHDGKKLGVPVTFSGKRFAYVLDLGAFASLALEWGEDIKKWARKSIRLEVVKERDVIKASPLTRNVSARAVDYLV